MHFEHFKTHQDRWWLPRFWADAAKPAKLHTLSMYMLTASECVQTVGLAESAQHAAALIYCHRKEQAALPRAACFGPRSLAPMSQMAPIPAAEQLCALCGDSAAATCADALKSGATRWPLPSDRVVRKPCSH